MNLIEGNLEGKGSKIAIVASRFNDFINEKLIGGARDCLLRHGVSDDDITLVRVPGAFEIPFAAKKMADSKKFDAVICIGAIIRGATKHYEFISAEVTKGVSSVALSSGVPVLYGVVTAETLEQAIERAGSKAGNRGWDAALSALEMIGLNRHKL
ncbi:MAG: 6,7-dimethyl-8-ribityllumazine synthase [Nitrospinota bacterium]|nr:6,7-dimethyl-8-ribityllumazine synthase [Nitrospinota bacterium]